MKKKLNLILALSICSISSSLALADKPEWAGNGEKHSKYENREHVNEMTSKHQYKKYKKEKYEDEDEEYHERDDEHEEYNERDNVHEEYHKKDYQRSGNNNGEYYEGKGMSDAKFIEQKKDETKKNWIGKFFDFLN